MYRWQSVALARVQFLTSDDGIIDAAKDLLFLIGLQGFPDPHVSIGGSGGAFFDEGSAVLTWSIDDRTLIFGVNENEPACILLNDDASTVQPDGGVIRLQRVDFSLREPEGRSEITHLVGWLLFGNDPSAARKSYCTKESIIEATARDMEAEEESPVRRKPKKKGKRAA